MKQLCIFVSAVLALAPPAMMRGADAPQTPKPNIVLILADDLGYGDLGCYGHPTFKTPHLDRLASEGARLTQFNTPAPYCAPSRAALLTGRYPWRCGMPSNPHPMQDVVINRMDPGQDKIALPASEVTLAQLLKPAGYATACIGKWHLGHHPPFLPTSRGFDEYFGIPYSNDMRPVQLLEAEQVVEYPVVLTTLTRRYTERAKRFIERNRSHPFFLYLAHMHPHKPLAPGEAFYKKSGAGIYGDVIAELDASVGEILTRLKELGLDNNTLVMFTSDNGPSYGGSTGGLRGMKGSSFEGGYRVPLLARWPGMIPPGHVNHAPAILMDLFPTALAAAGVPLPSDRVLDGRSLLPMLTSDARSPHEVVFGMSGVRLAAVRDARWKLHLSKPNDPMRPPGPDPRGPDGVTILAPFEQRTPSEYPGLKTGDAPLPTMLFDLLNDPGEQRDVAAEHPEEVARLSKLADVMKREMALKTSNNK